VSSSLLYLVSPLATLIAVVLAYIFGRSQGRSQTRYEKSGEIVTDLRRRILSLKWHYRRWVNEPSDETSHEVVGVLYELVRAYEEGMPWLEPHTIEKLQPLISAMRYEGLYHYGILKTAGEEVQRIRDEATAGLRKWVENDLDPLVDDLESEVRRLIGTKRVWDRYRRSGREPQTKAYDPGEIPELF
jgi:hypothetical protein